MDYSKIMRPIPPGVVYLTGAEKENMIASMRRAFARIGKDQAIGG